MSKPFTVVSNRKAFYEYHVLQEFEAGVMLTGSEVKSLRDGKVNVGDAYCSFTGGQLTITSLHISEYTHAGFSQHPPRRMRTLLLNKSELKKIRERLKDQGVTIVPLDIHFGERGFAKIQIALVKGKKLFDKRDAIKSRDMERQLKRGEVE